MKFNQCVTFVYSNKNNTNEFSNHDILGMVCIVVLNDSGRFNYGRMFQHGDRNNLYFYHTFYNTVLQIFIKINYMEPC